MLLLEDTTRCYVYILDAWLAIHNSINILMWGKIIFPGTY